MNSSIVHKTRQNSLDKWKNSTYKTDPNVIQIVNTDNRNINDVKIESFVTQVKYKRGKNKKWVKVKEIKRMESVPKNINYNYQSMILFDEDKTSPVRF